MHYAALEGAVNRQQEARSTTKPAQNPRIALTHLLLAMTEHQLENVDAARKHFESAQEILDAHVDDPTTYDSELDWWIFARTVLAEAERTLSSD